MAAEIATADVLCLEAACAAAEAAAFLPLFFPPAICQLKRLHLSLGLFNKENSDPKRPRGALHQDRQRSVPLLPFYRLHIVCKLH